ncbi:unnamed protein product [Adineta ricciae]|uniref:Uncharacterized protein n=1 Tax=Adineta ricciae TaxID=249248 RepID=A0A815DXI9_ADIRI|nr:unnamed protein product [Adineta ricciae]CAF1657719.1 unnamed protein product [Adineta ricciae]
MTRSERESLQKRIVQFFVNIADGNKSLTVNHFMKEKTPRQTIYSIIKKYEEAGHTGDKPRSGRPKKLCQGQLTRLKRLVNHKTGISLRRISSKNEYQLSQKQRSPKYTDKQLQEIPTRGRKLYRLLSNNDFELVMDDEKYFTLSDHSALTNRGFYSSNKEETPHEVKLKRTQKYEPKVLVWVAISENGISSPFFAKQQQAIDQTTYLNECVVKRLMPFISNYHLKEKVLFWPDLASSHYSNIVTRYFDENHIEFVDKDFNPQNCPQSRPIETLWAILKNMVYDQGWEAKNIGHLKRRIQQKMKEIDIEVVQTMFSGIRKQLRKIADYGPYKACSL